MVLNAQRLNKNIVAAIDMKRSVYRAHRMNYFVKLLFCLSLKNKNDLLVLENYTSMSD